MKPHIKEMLVAGELPAYSSIGGYPIFYWVEDYCTLCPTCANKDKDSILDANCNWEDQHLFCDNCFLRIESAYTEEEEVRQ